MSDEDSVFGKIKRTIAGPTPAAQAAELKERASEDPESVDTDDRDALVGLLDEDDRDVVSDALYALESLAEDRPALVSPATPAVVSDLSNRPGDEWSGTSLGEMSDEFMQDLARGSILLTLANEDPSKLDPVVEELVSKYTGEDALEPHSLLALAHVVAAAPGRTELSRDPFVEWVATEIEAAVEAEDDEFGIQIAETVELVELIADLGGASAVETLELAKRRSDDEEVVTTAERALSRLDTGE